MKIIRFMRFLFGFIFWITGIAIMGKYNYQEIVKAEVERLLNEQV